MKLKRSYKLDAPKGVRGRNSDNTLIKKLMNWAPSIRLEDGMEKTYKWIHDEMTSGKVSVVNALPQAGPRGAVSQARHEKQVEGPRTAHPS